MDTISILMAQYDGKAVVPLDVVCHDYFAPLTVPTLVRKISAGEIELVLVRLEHSSKSAKGVRLQDLAHYIDTRKTIGTARAKVDPAVARPDDVTPVAQRSPGRQPIAPPAPPPEGEDSTESTMAKALTLKQAAELLSVSYSTVYEHKTEMGFFQIGNQWRVWPSTLKARLAAKQEEKRHPGGAMKIPMSDSRAHAHALPPNALKVQRELDRLLAKRFPRADRKKGSK